MKKVNIAHIKAHISDYIDTLQKGGALLLCRRNEPIAEIRGIAKSRVRKVRRQIGFAVGQGTIDPTFFEPLPDEVIAGFYGDGE
jgi:antitoxin (DNA-binding transcriptional repressor) of toxin-antitoxin stability system